MKENGLGPAPDWPSLRAKTAIAFGVGLVTLAGFLSLYFRHSDDWFSLWGSLAISVCSFYKAFSLLKKLKTTR